MTVSSPNELFQDFVGALRGIAATIGAAQHEFQTAQSSEKNISTTTQKRLLAKSSKDLAKSLQSTHALLTQMEQHCDNLHISSRISGATDSSYEDISTQLVKLQRDHDETYEQLQATQQGEIQAKRMCSDLSQEVERIQQQMLEKDESYNILRNQMNLLEVSLNESDQNLQQQRIIAEQATQQAVEATQKANEIENRFSGLQQRADKAERILRQHEQHISRLAGELVAAQASKASLECQTKILESERDALQSQVDKQSGPWFDAVRREVEQRVSQQLAQSYAADNEWQERVSRLEEQLQERLEVANKATDQCQQVHNQLQSAEQHNQDLLSRMQRLAIDLDTVKDQNQSSLQEADRCRADHRVMQQQLKQLQADEYQQQMKVRDLSAEIQNVKINSDQLESRLTSTNKELDEAREEISRQVELNEQIMKRKEQVEWELMEAMAKMERLNLEPRNERASV